MTIAISILTTQLSDSSEVYDVTLTQGDATIGFHCRSERDAVELEEKLHQIIWDHTADQSLTTASCRRVA